MTETCGPRIADLASRALKGAPDEQSAVSHGHGALHSHPTDVGVVIALAEEFTEVLSLLSTQGDPVPDEEFGGYDYPFTAGPTAFPYQCVARLVAEMGPVPTALATERLIVKWQPHVVAIIGIAGGLHADVRLGDVVVASQVDAYLAQVKAVPGAAGGGWVFEHRGCVFQCDHKLLQEVSHLPFAHKDAYTSWCRAGAADLEVQLPHAGKRAELINSLFVRAEPVVLTAHLASGPVLDAATGFGEWILARDRTTKAIEMESAGLSESAAKRCDPLRTLIIRGISDFADERKSHLDALGNGSLRRLATRNATRFLLALLAGGVVPRRTSRSRRHLPATTDGQAPFPVVSTRGQSRERAADPPPILTPTRLPYPQNSFFTGRKRVLARLAAGFADRSGLSRRIQVLSGLGGRGKTQTALEFAYRNRGSYAYTFWVRADTPSTLMSDLLEIANSLRLPETHGGTSERIIAALKDWLNANPRWLLVADNADDLTALVPCLPNDPKGHIIVTSRATVFQTIGVANPIELDDFVRPEALAFLIRRTGRNRKDKVEVASARALAKELGWLPLALEQAAAYIVAKRANFSAYLDSYKKHPMKLLSKSRPVAGNYEQSVATTWLLNFREVVRASKAAGDLLRLTSFLGADNIPFELLTKGASKLGATLSGALRNAWDDSLVLNETLEPLLRYSLIKLDPDSRSYSIHRMLQEVIRGGLSSDKRRTWARRAVEAVNEAFPYVYGAEQWSACERLLPHARVAQDLIAHWSILSEAAGRLLTQTAYYYYKRSRYSEAEPLYQQSLAVRTAVLGEMHPEVATSLNLLGELYRAQGRYLEAESLQKRSLELRERVTGVDSRDVALSLDNLGAIYTATGRYSDAKPLFERALMIRKTVLGPSHRKVAASLNYIGFLCYTAGEFEEAARYHREALTIRESALGVNHAHVARSLNNLALVCWAQGKLSEAERLHKRALDIRARQGKDHPDVAASQNNLATVYRDQGRFTEAKDLYERALVVRRQVFGEEHPDFAATLHNMGILSFAQGQHESAGQLLERAAAIRKRTLGPAHPYLAHSLHVLGQVYVAKGDYASAEDRFQGAIAIREKADGNPKALADTLEKYAQLMQKLGREAEAAVLRERLKRGANGRAI